MLGRSFSMCRRAASYSPARTDAMTSCCWNARRKLLTNMNKNMPLSPTTTHMLAIQASRVAGSDRSGPKNMNANRPTADRSQSRIEIRRNFRGTSSEAPTTANGPPASDIRRV
jgi:hypothetical protein